MATRFRGFSTFPKLMPGPEETAESIANLAVEWFGPVAGALEQGDVLVDFPVAWLDVVPGGDLTLKHATATRTVVVMTQSCDLAKGAEIGVTLADARSYATLTSQPGSDHLRSSASRKALRQGMSIGELLLPPCPGAIDDWHVISFRHTFVLPKAYVEAHIDPKSRRIRSPYKEHVAQGYARFMMRVGLPMNLNLFK